MEASGSRAGRPWCSGQWLLDAWLTREGLEEGVSGAGPAGRWDRRGSGGRRDYSAVSIYVGTVGKVGSNQRLVRLLVGCSLQCVEVGCQA